MGPAGREEGGTAAAGGTCGEVAGGEEGAGGAAAEGAAEISERARGQQLPA